MHHNFVVNSPACYGSLGCTVSALSYSVTGQMANILGKLFINICYTLYDHTLYLSLTYDYSQMLAF